MHMIKLIIDMLSRFTSQRAMYPATPSSMEMMQNATHRQHKTLGMKMKLINIMIRAPNTIHWMLVGFTSSNWSKKTKYGWKTLAFNGDSTQIRRSCFTMSFSWFVPLTLTACIKNLLATMCSSALSNFTSKEKVFVGPNQVSFNVFIKLFSVFMSMPRSTSLSFTKFRKLRNQLPV